MLAASPLRNTKDEIEGFGMGGDDFGGFSDGSLLESIDFDDLFISINDGDVLPDLEMDSEILAEFSVTSGEEESEINTSERVDIDYSRKLEEVDKVWESTLNPNEEIVSKTDSTTTNPPRKQIDKDKRSSAQSKNPQPKRKVKVDWTPELHRRFVQAVEQLGVDKAVPSRILEIMGIDCLTRHNIASHLQKYRSHRKHLLAREAEAASWSQRRQMYGGTATGTGGSKRNISPWLAPTMGFPPMTPMHHFRPLHVWGHPSVDPSTMHVWPKHLLPSSPSPPPPAWPPTPHLPPPPRPTPEPPFWHSHYQRVAACPTPGTPCFPPPFAPTRFTAPPVVPGVPPHAMYKLDPGVGVPTGKPGPHHPPLDFYPSKESVDAAIEDVISKPWQPLPLGLKPPSMDSVLDELQRQGIPSIPPTTCA